RKEITCSCWIEQQFAQQAAEHTSPVAFRWWRHFRARSVQTNARCPTLSAQNAERTGHGKVPPEAVGELVDLRARFIEQEFGGFGGHGCSVDGFRQLSRHDLKVITHDRQGHGRAETASIPRRRLRKKLPIAPLVPPENALTHDGVGQRAQIVPRHPWFGLRPLLRVLSRGPL